MKKIYLVSLEDGYLIGSETTGDIYNPVFHNKVITFHTDEGLATSDRHKIVIASLGPATVLNIFFHKVIKEFCELLDTREESFTIEKIGNLYIEFIKKNYFDIQEQIFSIQLVLNIHADNNLLVTRFKIKTNKEDTRFITENIQIKKNTLFVISVDGYVESHVEKNLEKVKDNLFKNLTILNRAPLSLITLSTGFKINAWNRGFSHHPFEYLDDFFVSIQNNYYGGETSESFKLTDLDDIIKNISTQYVDTRFITFKDFIRICRNRIPKGESDFLEFYLQVYSFVNKLAKEDKLFGYKLRLILKNDILFFLERSTDPEGGVMAFYEWESKCIFLHPDRMKKYSFDMQGNIFRHEVEHAYKELIHKKRCLTKQMNLEEKDFIRQYGYGTPYFPFYNNEKGKWFNFAFLGLKRTREVLNLLELEQKETLNPSQNLKVKKYRELVKNYKPKYIAQPLDSSPELLKFMDQQKEKLNTVLCISVSIHGLVVPLSITKIRKISEKTLLTEGYATTDVNQINLKTLIYDLHFTFNLNFDKQSNFPELHAHLVGEYPPEILAFFFREILEYDYQDAKEALDTDIPTYRAYLAEPSPFLINLNDNTNSNDNNNKSSYIGNPITAKGDFHDNLMKQIIAVIGKDTKDFKAALTALNDRDYPKALRNICSAYADEAYNNKVYEIAEILLSYKDKLGFNINEPAGKDQYSALHHAASKQNRRLYDLLVRHGADTSLISKNGTAIKLLTAIGLTNSMRSANIK